MSCLLLKLANLKYSSHIAELSFLSDRKHIFTPKLAELVVSRRSSCYRHGTNDRPDNTV